MAAGEAGGGAVRRGGRGPLILGLVVLALAAIGLFAILRGRGGDGAAEGADTLIIGDQKGGVQALLRAAGELDHVPYKIRFALFPAASPLLEALDAGAVDVGGIGGAPFAFAYASGARIKAVTAYRPMGDKAGRASAIIVSRGSPLHGVRDLAGKRLATIRGSAGQDLALRLLERAGLRGQDVTWVYLANGEAKAALATGSIDAWSIWGSYVGIATLVDGDRILADAHDLTVGAGFFAANDAAIARKRALLEDFVTRLSRARAWGRTHQEDYAQVLAKETGLPIAVARFSISSALGQSVPIDAALVEQQRAIFTRYKAAGVIPSVPDLAGAYDASFNKALVPGSAVPAGTP